MITQYNQDIKVLQYENLSYCDIFHFVTTRDGGVSQGAYASFNLSPYSGDNPEHVARNREIFSGLLKSELILPYQTHEDKILCIGPGWHTLAPAEKTRLLHGVDALMTDTPGLCIGVSTADCVPVLLYDPVRRVVAAVHAGWRGTVKHIVSKTVAMMQSHYGTNPSDIYAGIGPSISQLKFEVGEEVTQAFSEAGYNIPELVVRNTVTGKAHIDLWRANTDDLRRAGVPESHIEVSGICSVRNADQFFSARTLGIKSGRTVSGIMMK